MVKYEEYLPVLKKLNLFLGVSENEIHHMMSCMNPQKRSYEKNETILRAGEQIHSFGLLLSGTALIEKEDFWGNVAVMSALSSGSMFAEVYAALSQIPTDVTVIATSHCEIMFFDLSAFTSLCGESCSYHSRIIQNVMTSIARRTLQLNQKIDCISKRTIRDKLMAYLSSESMRQHNNTFDIPYNRQQLADYLFVDRSALSNEISKLTREGLIRSQRNHFEILREI